MSQARRVADADDYWSNQPLGVPIPVLDNLVGVLAPPTDQLYRYIKLTAGEDGAGQYNEGALSGESVIGSDPDIDATAVVSDPASPILGQTVRLINTTREFMRPGNAGVAQADELREHQHDYVGHSNTIQAGSSGVGGFLRNTTTRTTELAGGAETRPRNLGATFYMRIR